MSRKKKKRKKHNIKKQISKKKDAHQLSRVHRHSSDLSWIDNISAGAFILFLTTSLTVAVNSGQLHSGAMNIFRLLGTTIIGCYYVVTYRTEMKEVSLVTDLVLSIYDYIAMIAMFIVISLLIYTSIDPVKYTIIFPIVIIADLIFVVTILTRHGNKLSSNYKKLAELRWWFVSDFPFLLIAIAAQIFSAYSPDIASMSTLCIYVIIFLLDYTIRRYIYVNE